jgi:hypothetical protein
LCGNRKISRRSAGLENDGLLRLGPATPGKDGTRHERLAGLARGVKACRRPEVERGLRYVMLKSLSRFGLGRGGGAAVKRHGAVTGME